MKRYIGLFVVALLALSVVSTVGVVSAKGPLAAPTLTSPDNGHVYTPGEPVTLRWNAVPHATGYEVWWISYTEQVWHHSYTTATSYIYLTNAPGNGDQVAWNVQAVKENPNGKITSTGPWSAEQYFYT